MPNRLQACAAQKPNTPADLLIQVPPHKPDYLGRCVLCACRAPGRPLRSSRASACRKQNTCSPAVTHAHRWEPCLPSDSCARPERRHVSHGWLAHPQPKTKLLNVKPAASSPSRHLPFRSPSPAPRQDDDTCQAFALSQNDRSLARRSARSPRLLSHDSERSNESHSVCLACQGVTTALRSHPQYMMRALVFLLCPLYSTMSPPRAPRRARARGTGAVNARPVALQKSRRNMG